MIGIDLSPAMVEFGQRTHPAVEFREGDLLSLPAKNNEFAAVVCFYSIIHLRHEELPRAFSEFRRTLRPGGRFVLSFHVGTEVRHSSEWLGHDVDLDFRFFERGTVNLLLEKSGLAVEATLERTNYPQEVPTRRAYVMGIRP